MTFGAPRKNLLVIGIVVLLVAGGCGLYRVHQANVVARKAYLVRLQRAETETHRARRNLTSDVAEYSSAHDAGTAATDASQKAKAIERAQAADASVANDVAAVARAFAAVYGNAATQKLLDDGASAHAACARSLEDWNRAVRSSLQSRTYSSASQREDAECGRYGMSVGTEIEALASRLDADLAATRASLSAL